MDIPSKQTWKTSFIFVFGYFLGAFLSFFACLAHGQDYPYLSSPTGQYMGEVSDDHLRRDSISNDLGRYGSSLSPDSIHNPLGQFGSEYSSESPYYIGRTGSLERPENTSRSRLLREELRRDRDYRE